MPNKAFVEAHKNAVIAACAGTTLFPSVKMAQMILESGWGTSWLAQNANNYFGIKAFGGWRGKTVRRLDRAEGSNDLYRVYDNMTDNIRDHTYFLKQNTRYTKHGVFTAKTPFEQTRALASAGYATATGYDILLNNIIKSNNLTRLDAIKLKPNKPSRLNNFWLWLAGIAGGVLFVGGCAYTYIYFSNKNRV